LLYEFDFPKSVCDGSSVLRNFMRDNTTTKLCLFEYVDIIVPILPRKVAQLMEAGPAPMMAMGFL
jgi:hypothetical protein